MGLKMLHTPGLACDELDVHNRAGSGEGSLHGVTPPHILPSSLRSQVRLRYDWSSMHHKYRLRSGEAAAFERGNAWVAAAHAWESALEVATGGNVEWCRSRYAWCLARSLKTGR